MRKLIELLGVLAVVAAIASGAPVEGETKEDSTAPTPLADIVQLLEAANPEDNDIVNAVTEQPELVTDTLAEDNGDNFATDAEMAAEVAQEQPGTEDLTIQEEETTEETPTFLEDIVLFNATDINDELKEENETLIAAQKEPAADFESDLTPEDSFPMVLGEKEDGTMVIADYFPSEPTLENTPDVPLVEYISYKQNAGSIIPEAVYRPEQFHPDVLPVYTDDTQYDEATMGTVSNMEHDYPDYIDAPHMSDVPDYPVESHPMPDDIDYSIDNHPMSGSMDYPVDNHPMLDSMDYPVDNHPMLDSMDYPTDNHPMSGSMDYPTDNHPMSGSMDYPAGNHPMPGSMDYPVDSHPMSDSIYHPMQFNSMPDAVDYPVDSYPMADHPFDSSRQLTDSLDYPGDSYQGNNPDYSDVYDETVSYNSDYDSYSREPNPTNINYRFARTQFSNPQDSRVIIGARNNYKPEPVKGMVPFNAQPLTADNQDKMIAEDPQLSSTDVSEDVYELPDPIAVIPESNDALDPTPDLPEEIMPEPLIGEDPSIVADTEDTNIELVPISDAAESSEGSITDVQPQDSADEITIRLNVKDQMVYINDEPFSMNRPNTILDVVEQYLKMNHYVQEALNAQSLYPQSNMYGQQYFMEQEMPMNYVNDFYNYDPYYYQQSFGYDYVPPYNPMSDVRRMYLLNRLNRIKSFGRYSNPFYEPKYNYPYYW